MIQREHMVKKVFDFIADPQSHFNQKQKEMEA